MKSEIVGMEEVALGQTDRQLGQWAVGMKHWEVGLRGIFLGSRTVDPYESRAFGKDDEAVGLHDNEVLSPLSGRGKIM
jgi:hypothetical protein